MFINSVVIDAEHGMEDYGSFPHNIIGWGLKSLDVITDPPNQTKLVVKAKKNFYILKKNLSSNERENGKIDTHLCLCEMGQFFFFFFEFF
jgi:hypothetical protein